MATFEDLSSRREKLVHVDKLMRTKAKALMLLREAMYAANRSSEETKTGDPRKVWKVTYEAVIASAPTDIREIANFLRNYFGRRSVH